MSVAAYCRRAACSVRAQETLVTAAQRMEKEGIGLLVVTDRNERLKGVLSDRDIALHVAAGGHSAARARVGEAMSPSPACIDADASLDEVFRILGERRVRRLPVVGQDGRVLGLVSTDDLARLLAREIGSLGELLAAQLPPSGTQAQGHATSRNAPWRGAEHYHRDVVTARPATSIAWIGRKMREQAVGSVVVLDEDGRASGIVTDRDVALRVVATGLDPGKTNASSVMSSPVIGAEPSEPLEEIVERMRSRGVRRLPILRDGRPVAIVSFDDLLVTFGSELEQLGRCIAGEIQSARAHSYAARIRHDLEELVEDAAAQLRRLGDQTLRSLGGEVEQIVERVTQTLGFAAPRAEPAELRVRDLMQTEVRTCTPEDALTDAVRIMWERDCGCVPVVASEGSGRVVGMITDRDVCMAVYTRGEPPAQMRVNEAMAGRVAWCHPHDTLAEAEHIMSSNQVRRLPVVDTAGHLRGILSLADIAEAAAGRSAAVGMVSDAEVAHTLEVICRPRKEKQR